MKPRPRKYVVIAPKQFPLPRVKDTDNCIDKRKENLGKLLPPTSEGLKIIEKRWQEISTYLDRNAK